MHGPKISFSSDYPSCPVLLIIIFSCKASPLIVNVPRELHAVINKFVTQIFGTGHFSCLFSTAVYYNNFAYVMRRDFGRDFM